MSCTHPFLAKCPTMSDRLHGRTQWKILGAYDKFPDFQDFREYFYADGSPMYGLLPCGKCISCRLNYTREWASRCVLESYSYDPDTCWFVTLTYRDEVLKDPKYDACVIHEDFIEYQRNKFLNYDQIRQSALLLGHYDVLPLVKTLVYKDLQDFLKRLRYKWESEYNIKNIRFFASGEYGDKSGRSHFHLLIFGLPLFDKKFYKCNRLGDSFYISDELENVWGLGYAPVSQFNWLNASYTAQYIMKKHKGVDADYYIKNGLVPPGSRMSRMPGIGYAYFAENWQEIFERDEIVLPACKGKSNVIKAPRYFMRLLEKRSDQSSLELLREVSPDSDFSSDTFYDLLTGRIDPTFNDEKLILNFENDRQLAKAFLKATKDARSKCAQLKHAEKMAAVTLSEIDYLDMADRQINKRIQGLTRFRGSFDYDPLRWALDDCL